MKVLPIKCEAYYLPGFLTAAESEALFSELVNGFDVTDRRVRMVNGAEHLSETGAYMFADPELTTFDALPAVWGQRSPWTDSLVSVRNRIATQTGICFQVARSIYYRDGSAGMDFHLDLPAYGSTSAIASLSLGAEREFALRNASDSADSFSIQLSPGSLLFLGEGCQATYEHALLRDERCTKPRLNLTFRKYGGLE